MGDASYGNAMTEIALALAMAFFSIMVLAMVSMGAPATDAQAANPAAPPVKLTLAPRKNDSGKNAEPKKKREIVVFWQGRFLDKDLKPVNTQTKRFDGPIILALSPDLSMAEALDARGKLKAKKIVVSTLDKRWLETLSQSTGKSPGQSIGKE
jgi:hypothetical protein